MPKFDPRTYAQYASPYVPEHIRAAYAIAKTWTEDGGFIFRVTLLTGAVIEGPTAAGRAIRPEYGAIEIEDDEGSTFIPYASILSLKVIYLPV